MLLVTERAELCLPREIRDISYVANVSLNVQGCTMGLDAIFTRYHKDVAIDKQA